MSELSEFPFIYTNEYVDRCQKEIITLNIRIRKLESVLEAAEKVYDMPLQKYREQLLEAIKAAKTENKE